MSGFLSHKQSWRRVKVEPKSVHEAAYDVKHLNTILSGKSMSDPSMKKSGTYFDAIPFLRSLSSNGNSHIKRNSKWESALPASQKPRKKVSFEDGTVRVMLIPTREEIQKCTCDNPIWWSADDYAEFKADAVKELKALMAEHSHLDTKAAIQLLYQPENLQNL